MSLGGVVGGHSLNGYVVGQLLAVSVFHHGAFAVEVGAALVHNKLRLAGREQADGGRVVVVEVLVGYKYDVGLGHCRVVHRAAVEFCAGVYLYLVSVVLYADARVHQCVYLNQPAAFGGEDVCLHLGDRFAGLLPCKDAAVEVVYRAALLGEHFRCHEAALAAAAEDGYGALDADSALGKVGGSHVDVLRPGDMALGILLGCPHIDKAYMLLRYCLGKVGHAHRLYGLLVGVAALCVAAPCG